MINNHDEKLVSISYTDRYLYSPLTLALLYQIIEGLKSNLGNERMTNFDFELMTAPNTNNNYVQRNLVKSDWIDSVVRDRIAELIFNQPEINFSLQIKNKYDMSHGRMLKLKFSSGGEIIIRFDQGVSYWTLAWAARRESVIFDFNDSEAQQCEVIKRLNIGVMGNDLPTQIYLSMA